MVERDWSSDVCSPDLQPLHRPVRRPDHPRRPRRPGDDAEAPALVLEVEALRVAVDVEAPAAHEPDVDLVER